MRSSAATAVLCAAALLVGCAGSGQTRDGRIQPDTAQQQRRSAAEVHTELGQRYLQRGQLEVALEKLEKALSFDSGYVPAHTVIAVLYEQIGNMPLAEQHYRRAERLDPRKGSVNNNLGQFLCRTGRVQEALPYFDKAVADPFYETPGAAYVNAGTCLVMAGNPQAATDKLREALALDPNNPDALYQMANALVQQQDWFRARAFIQRFDALGDPRPEALLLGYTIESSLGEREAARAYANKLRDRFPDSQQARSLQGIPSS